MEEAAESAMKTRNASRALVRLSVPLPAMEKPVETMDVAEVADNAKERLSAMRGSVKRLDAFRNATERNAVPTNAAESVEPAT